MSQQVAATRGLSREQQKAVLAAKPTVEKLLRKLRRVFGARYQKDDMSQDVWEGFIEVVLKHDPPPSALPALAWQHAFGKAVDEAMRDARQSPIYLLKKAFLPAAEQIEDTDDIYVADEEILGQLKGACEDGAFRMFFGCTFETWRVQGEQGIVDEITRLKAFDKLKSAITTLTERDWQLPELYYVKCRTWAAVGEELGVSERHAKRLDEEIRAKLRRELQVRGVKGPPPERS